MMGAGLVAFAGSPLRPTPTRAPWPRSRPSAPAKVERTKRATICASVRPVQSGTGRRRARSRSPYRNAASSPSVSFAYTGGQVCLKTKKLKKDRWLHRRASYSAKAGTVYKDSSNSRASTCQEEEGVPTHHSSTAGARRASAVTAAVVVAVMDHVSRADRGSAALRPVRLGLTVVPLCVVLMVGLGRVADLAGEPEPLGGSRRRALLQTALSDERRGRRRRSLESLRRTPATPTSAPAARRGPDDPRCRSSGTTPRESRLVSSVLDDLTSEGFAQLADSAADLDAYLPTDGKIPLDSLQRPQAPVSQADAAFADGRRAPGGRGRLRLRRPAQDQLPRPGRAGLRRQQRARDREHGTRAAARHAGRRRSRATTC